MAKEISGDSLFWLIIFIILAITSAILLVERSRMTILIAIGLVLSLFMFSQSRKEVKHGRRKNIRS